MISSETSGSEFRQPPAAQTSHPAELPTTQQSPTSPSVPGRGPSAFRSIRRMEDPACSGSSPPPPHIFRRLHPRRAGCKLPVAQGCPVSALWLRGSAATRDDNGALRPQCITSPLAFGDVNLWKDPTPTIHEAGMVAAAHSLEGQRQPSHHSLAESGEALSAALQLPS
ncbi:MAG UNVERIFIED_CONTAM: hypothetical protein LVR18_37500 [Planctomycetaceae bacterium]